VLHLVLGLVLAYAALGFVRIAQAVTGEELIVQVDLAVANALHAAATPDGIAFFRLYTFLGGGRALTALGVVVLLVLVARRQRVLAIGWAVASLGGGLLNGALKGIFERPRPAFADPIAVVEGWSFPSGHSMGTFIIVGMLAYLAYIHVRSPAVRVGLVAAAMVWIALMGFSRMYLGAHYLSDVVAGFAAGTVWLAGCISGVEIARRRSAGRVAPPPRP
jgi:undecaprenyl-diphosphatase